MTTVNMLKKLSMATAGGTVLLGVTVFGAVEKAAAGVIISPTSAVINSSGPGFGSITDTINQNGLLTNFVSGVTDFDAYLATNPQHTLTFSGYEWFGNSGTTTASVTYDLGAVKFIDALALWNEESSGIGLLDLYSSLDGVNFSALSLGLTPIDNPLANYPAEVFSFSTIAAQYIRFDISQSPQPNPGSFPSAAIGEVAFRQVQVPEPASIIGILGLGAFGVTTLRKRKQATAVKA
ncbi:PEP-CTERM sorting domain-containing protein [Anabaena cylindrica UHCC 0172]|nr:PEP-CTERM sorting domain-containing protein [Anabaena cylindrica]MEA5551388.1 PEP-CTERM sorting domain-containing protein [Anabaena cylindrica UHCC 0172]